MHACVSAPSPEMSGRIVVQSKAAEENWFRTVPSNASFSNEYRARFPRIQICPGPSVMRSGFSLMNSSSQSRLLLCALNISRHWPQREFGSSAVISEILPPNTSISPPSRFDSWRLPSAVSLLIRAEFRRAVFETMKTCLQILEQTYPSKVNPKEEYRRKADRPRSQAVEDSIFC